MKENQLEKPNSNLPSRYRKTMEISKNICKLSWQRSYISASHTKLNKGYVS